MIWISSQWKGTESGYDKNRRGQAVDTEVPSGWRRVRGQRASVVRRYREGSGGRGKRRREDVQDQTCADTEGE